MPSSFPSRLSRCSLFPISRTRRLQSSCSTDARFSLLACSESSTHMSCNSRIKLMTLFGSSGEISGQQILAPSDQEEVHHLPVQTPPFNRGRSCAKVPAISPASGGIIILSRNMTFSPYAVLGTNFPNDLTFQFSFERRSIFEEHGIVFLRFLITSG